jgi:hypothetical protein
MLRFDPHTIPGQQDDLDIVYREIFMWTRSVKLNLDPAIPKGMINRVADNWRPLFSIADACSKAGGEAAREAAVALSTYRDEDFGVILLADIRKVFDGRVPADRLSSATLVAELNDMTDALWCEWRGPRGDQSPVQLSQAQLALMLSPFGIGPRTIWPSRRHSAS